MEKHDLKETGRLSVPRFLRHKKIFLFSSIILALVAFHVIVSSLNGNHRAQNVSAVSPLKISAAWNDMDRQLAEEKSRHHSGGELPASVAKIVGTAVKGHFSVYVEDLKTGAWWGIDEKETYAGWSLFKVPTLIAILKKAEREKISLDEPMPMTVERNQDSRSVMQRMADQPKYTIKTMAEQMITTSDDATAITLCNLITFDEFQEGLRATDMPLITTPGSLPLISPEQYANVLRSLYFSKYLDKSSSEVVLSLMSNTRFDTEIRAGVPSGVAVAHKVGFDSASGASHDCGIVYLPNRPYLLCIMSRDTSEKESSLVMSTVSREVYNFMNTGVPGKHVF